MNDAPCKGCEERTLGCHAKCEEYIEYRKRLDEILEERQKVRMLNEADTLRPHREFTSYKREVNSRLYKRRKGYVESHDRDNG